jgi:hypothetical protein
MNWTARDWASVFIGWICGACTVILLPAVPWKLAAVFAAGFTGAWTARLFIPRD